MSAIRIIFFMETVLESVVRMAYGVGKSLSVKST